MNPIDIPKWTMETGIDTGILKSDGLGAQIAGFGISNSRKSKMDDEKARAYVELASKMTELHASIALLTQNVDKMARTDAEVTSMTKIFQGVCVETPLSLLDGWMDRLRCE